MDYKYDVFISYSRKDSTVADDICNFFKLADISYFIDRSTVSGSDHFIEVEWFYF